MATDYIRFTGTGSAAVSKERSHSSFVFQSSGKFCLMDAGDGISRALLINDIPFNEISSIIISHMHPDHYSGLAGLLIQMKLKKRKDVLSLHIHESLQDTILSFINSSYLFPKRLGFPLQVTPYANDQAFYPLENLEAAARQNSHLKDYIKDSPGGISFSCSSYLFKFNNRSIYYSGDIGSRDDLYLFNDHKIDIMICEVTHIDLPQIFKAFRISGAGLLYLTHLSGGDEQRINSLKNSPDYDDLSNKILIAQEGMSLSF